ncbi:enoyl-CoA hydratase/isomerase family protein [Amycolatopsis magusensis]|uniref:enoyl-CoA hydratase/isomerase family protein n=1 Tax=Amycolatopsis magusensis TaxID=882444 RepID=UPI003C2B8B5F
MTGAGSERPPAHCAEVGDVAVLTLDRPHHGNALTAAMLAELVRITAGLHSSDGARAVILTGAGNTFCTGADLAELEQLLVTGATGELIELTEALATFVRALRSLPCPVIAAVNGIAAGAGFSLALACDVRLAADRSAFHFAYGALGSSTDGGMSWFLPRIVGAARAVTLLLEQPVLRPKTALELDLVSGVVPSGALLETAVELGRRYARHTRHSIRAAKRLVDLSTCLSLESHLHREHDEVVKGLIGADVRTALAAHRQSGR